MARTRIRGRKVDFRFLRKYGNKVNFYAFIQCCCSAWERTRKGGKSTVTKEKALGVIILQGPSTPAAPEAG